MEGLARGNDQDPNFQNVEEHVDDLYFLETLVPTGTTGHVVAGATIALVAPGGKNVSTLALAAAGDGYVYHNVRVRPLWNRHYIRLTIHYTSSVANAANFSLHVSFEGMPVAGGNLTGMTALYGAAVALAGPAVAWDAKSYSVNLTTSVLTSASYSHIRPAVELQASANPNVLSIYGMTMEIYRA